MKVLFAAALVGGLLGFTLLWPYGALTAVLGAQLGATSLAFLMCPVLALRRTKAEQKYSAGVQSHRRAKIASRSFPSGTSSTLVTPLNSP